jgi:hypothetical protein
MESQPAGWHFLSYSNVIIIISIVVPTVWLFQLFCQCAWFRPVPSEPAQPPDAKLDRSRFVAQQQETLNRASKELEEFFETQATEETDQQLRSRRITRETSLETPSSTNQTPAVPSPSTTVPVPLQASTAPPGSVPADRVIARNAFGRFLTLNMQDPAVRVWVRALKASGANPPEEFIRAFCYNKTQPDRVCPFCGVQYMPLPEGVRAATPAQEKLEEERRLSGICSRACFAKTGASAEDHFGEASERSVIAPGVVSTRRSDGTVATLATTRDSAGINVVLAGGAIARAPEQACELCSRSDVPLFLCSACHLVSYCSKDCQKKDRPKHSPLCRTGTEVLTALHGEW